MFRIILCIYLEAIDKSPVSDRFLKYNENEYDKYYVRILFFENILFGKYHEILKFFSLSIAIFWKFWKRSLNFIFLSVDVFNFKYWVENEYQEKNRKIEKSI